MKSLPYIVIVYMLAQSSCTPKLLKEYAGSPRTFYEKDTAELKLDIDSVKQYSRGLSYKIPYSGVISRPAASTSCRSFFITSAEIHLRSTLTVRTRLRLRTMSIGA